MRVKLLFSTVFTFLCIIFLGKNESLALAIQDSTLTSSQVSSLNQVRAVGLQTVGTVVVWNQTGDPGDMYNDDGRPVWLECDGSSFDTGYYTALAGIIPSGILPNLKDQFLRGGTSGQVGQMVQDSTREHYHGQPPHTHSFNGHLTSGSISGTAAGQSFKDFYTRTDYYGVSPYVADVTIDVSGDGVSFSYGVSKGYIRTDEKNNKANDSVVAGNVNDTSVVGVLSASGGDNTYKNSNSDGTNGGSETAPQHIRVRYLIRALP